MSEQEFWRDCSAVEIKDGGDPKVGGRPTVGAARLPAQDVADIAEGGATPEEIAAEFEEPVENIRAVLAYYYARQPQLTPSR